jgi:hypothetical protein
MTLGLRLVFRLKRDSNMTSTLGFDDIGFRFGTCYPWNLYDFMGEKDRPVIESPLIIQDGASLSAQKGLRLDEGTACLYIIQLIEEAESVLPAGLREKF